MAKYYITKSRYIQQVGQDQPFYVLAEPDFPAIVELDGDHSKDTGLLPITDGDSPPPKMKPHFALQGPGGAYATPPPQTSAEFHGPKSAAPAPSPAPTKGGRPSDKGI